MGASLALEEYRQLKSLIIFSKVLGKRVSSSLLFSLRLLPLPMGTGCQTPCRFYIHKINTQVIMPPVGFIEVANIFCHFYKPDYLVASFELITGCDIGLAF
jgi:hypothetical protein